MNFAIKNSIFLTSIILSIRQYLTPSDTMKFSDIGIAHKHSSTRLMLINNSLFLHLNLDTKKISESQVFVHDNKC